jgi:hypothetical protein
MRQHVASLWPVLIPLPFELSPPLSPFSPQMALSFASSEIIALCLESVLYGTSPSHPQQSSSSRVDPDRNILCFIPRLRQGPYRKEEAKVEWQLPPRRSFIRPFCPRHLGSSTTYPLDHSTSVDEQFSHSMKFLTLFASSSLTGAVKQIRAQIFITPMLPPCRVS